MQVSESYAHKSAMRYLLTLVSLNQNEKSYDSLLVL